jgi:alkanesulfonate monooxygenase SsuD/methylene tetrahydromethanopterin reductase-like flavin-dependent oxidoreductase (luciferase family)
VRTDEVVEATMGLLEHDDYSFDGRYYKLDAVTVEPHPRTLPPVWIGGGRQLEHEVSPEKSGMNKAVLDRIVRSDGWIARPTCPADLIEIDRQEIVARRAELGILDKPFAIAHENFTWLQETGSSDSILTEQQSRFRRIVSDERPWDYIDAVYLTGSIETIQAKIQQRIDAGVKHIMLHTLTSDLDQLELMAKHVLEPFKNA